MSSAWPWAGLGSAFIGAAALHASVLPLLLDASTGDRAAWTAPAHGDASRVMIDVRLATSMQTAAVAADPSPAPTRSPNEPTEMPTTADAIRADVSDAARYFAVSEVDTPAMPQPEWQVDVPRLAGAGVHSFSVDVLIDDSGGAERCTLTRMVPEQAPALRDAVAATLCTTALTPAVRRGVAVPSVRHIEVILAPE